MNNNSIPDNEMKDISVVTTAAEQLKIFQDKVSELEAKNANLRTAIKDSLENSHSIMNLLQDLNNDNLDLKIKICEQQTEINRLRASLKKQKND